MASRENYCAILRNSGIIPPMLIEKVTVRNFKILHNFTVEGLRPVTLLGGKNGCGKTSLLEAVLLCMHRKKSVYPFQIALRDKRPESRAIVELFHNLNTDGEFSVVCGGKNAECAAIGNIGEEWEDAFAPPRIADAGAGFPIGTAQVKLLTVDYKEDGRLRGVEVFRIKQNPPYVGVTFLEDEDSVRFHVSGDFIHYRPDGGLLGMFGADADTLSALELEQPDAKPQVVEVLRIAAPHVRDIALTKDKQDIVAVLEGGIVISAASLGAGARKLLSLALILHRWRDGLFLLDELTVGWHHSVLVDTWRMIFRVCKDCRHQVIATTHSDDAITAFVEAAELEKCQSDACYVRLDRKNKDGHIRVRPAVYDYEHLDAAREMELEIRG